MSQAAAFIDRSFKRRAPRGFVCAWVLIALTSLTGLAVASPADDTEPPVVLVLPHDPLADGAGVVLKARVSDPSGVGKVVVHVKAEGDADYKTFAMEHAEDDEYVANLPARPKTGSRVSYFIEATDSHGNGPRQSGNPRSPFVARLSDVPVAPAKIKGAKQKGIPLWPLATMPLPLLLLGMSLRNRRLEREFWVKILEPISRRHGSERVEVMKQVCSRVHCHPAKGYIKVTQAEVMEKMTQLSDLLPKPSVARRTETVVAGAGRDRYGNRTGPQAAAADGHSEAAEPVPAEEPVDREKDRAAGMSMIELLVVIALLGVMLLIGGLYLKPMEQPVHSAGQMLEGLLTETRAKAVATTTVHRVRPTSDDFILVESAATCSSGAWTADDRLSLQLPRDVTLSDTTWSVCFTSRGIASQNLVMTLDHPEYEPEQLEVMVGGAVRWVQ